MLSQNNLSAKKLKIKFQKRRVKPSTSPIILLKFFSPAKSYYWNVFWHICNNVSEENYLVNLIFNNVIRLNHSLPRSNSGTNKTQHFAHLFALGSQRVLDISFFLHQQLPPNQIYMIINTKMIIFVRIFCKLSASSKQIFG